MGRGEHGEMGRQQIPASPPQLRPHGPVAQAEAPPSPRTSSTRRPVHTEVLASVLVPWDWRAHPGREGGDTSQRWTPHWTVAGEWEGRVQAQVMDVGRMNA